MNELEDLAYLSSLWVEEQTSETVVSILPQQAKYNANEHTQVQVVTFFTAKVEAQRH